MTGVRPTKMIMELLEDGKTDEAYKLFGDVLNIDTENYTAITYRGLCSAW